jgi:hypothetical protein
LSQFLARLRSTAAVTFAKSSWVIQCHSLSRSASYLDLSSDHARQTSWSCSKLRISYSNAKTAKSNCRSDALIRLNRDVPKPKGGAVTNARLGNCNPDAQIVQRMRADRRFAGRPIVHKPLVAYPSSPECVARSRGHSARPEVRKRLPVSAEDPISDSASRDVMASRWV